MSPTFLSMAYEEKESPAADLQFSYSLLFFALSSTIPAIIFKPDLGRAYLSLASTETSANCGQIIAAFGATDYIAWILNEQT